MPRILVVGTSGAGKTTFARRLAARLNVAHVDMDDLFWGPAWNAVPREVYYAQLEKALSVEDWVASGNVSDRKPEVALAPADTIVWLDYAFAMVLWRVVIRTVRRCATGEPCCNGNREEWRKALSRDSIILWTIQTYARRRRAYAALFESANYGHLHRVRLKSPREAERWLREHS